MLVLQKAVKMVWELPEVMRVAYAFVFVMLCWLVIWTFRVAGTISLSADDGARWWLLVVFSVSLFWTGAVLCNTVHAIVSGMVFLVLIHGGRGARTMPPKPLFKSLQYALTTSFGSICYGSLFTAAIRTLRWEIAVNGKGFNHPARNAWELFQSTGVEALVAYDCSGAVLLMGIILGGLITGTCTAIWTHFQRDDRVIMVGTTAMLMGMILEQFDKALADKRDQGEDENSINQNELWDHIAVGSRNRVLGKGNTLQEIWLFSMFCFATQYIS